LAVDAGVHLSAIVGILEGHASDYSPSNPHKPVTLVDGPFAGLEIPHSSAKANAAHITRTLIGTYLITHPHLDHM
jgi:cAMP phosphodiesterase